MSRATAPQVSFADWELMLQGSTLDPLLAEISELLDREEEAIEKIRLDLERGLKRPAMGRGGLTPAQVLRSLVLMRIKSWDYGELREGIADGYSLRRFTHFYAQAVPSTTLSIVPLIGSRRNRCGTSTSWSCRRRWSWDWRMATDSEWTPPSCKVRYIIPPTTPCWRMRSASSPDWCNAWAKLFLGLSACSLTATAPPNVAVKRSNA